MQGQVLARCAGPSATSLHHKWQLNANTLRSIPVGKRQKKCPNLNKPAAPAEQVVQSDRLQRAAQALLQPLTPTP